MANRYLKDGTAGTASPYESDTTAATTLATLTALSLAVDEVIWVSSTHAESVSSSTTYTAPASATAISPQRLLCVTDFDASPGTLGTGCVFTAGNTVGSFRFQGHWYLHGIEFNMRYANSTHGGLYFGITNVPTKITLESCVIKSGSSAASVGFGPNGSTNNDDTEIILNNCSFLTAVVDNSIATLGIGHGSIQFNNLSLGGTTDFDDVFTLTAGCRSTVLVENSNFTGNTWNYLIDNAASSSYDVVFRNCKFNSSWVALRSAVGVGCRVAFYNCSDGDTNYEYRAYFYSGSIVHNTTIYATTSGASDGTTAISWQMVSLATCSIFNPLYSEWIHVWVDDTGTAITPSLEILVSGDGAAALTDADVWIECDAMDTASTPLGTRTTDRVAQVIDAGTNQAAGSTAWTGDGYTTERTHKLAVASFTPNKKGYVRCRVGLAKASTTIYVNPKIALS